MEENILTIRVFGTGCLRCNELEKMCFNVCAENDIDADIQKITDINKIAETGIMVTPALVINGKLYAKGKLPVKSTLKHWITENIPGYTEKNTK